MDFAKKGKMSIMIVVLSALFSYFLITLNYFPYLGISLTLILFSILVYSLKKVKNNETSIYFIITVTFALFIFIRSEGLLTFFNLTPTMFFGSLMSLSGNKFINYKFFPTITTPLYIVIKSLLTKNQLVSVSDLNVKKGISKNSLNNITGIIITIMIMAVVLPLLASANPYFQKYLGSFLSVDWIKELFINIGYKEIFVWSLRLVFFLFFIFIIPKFITLVNKTNIKSEIDLNLPSVPLTIPKITVAIVLILFFITQFQLYFSSDETLKQLGYSHSQYTREVFAQLTVVAFIVFILVYNGKIKTSLNTKLNNALVFQGIFLALMAFKSVLDYSQTWGFTYKRLYGFAVATWILGIFLMYLYKYKNKLSDSILIKNTVIYTGIMLMIVNIFNFDYLIYHYRKSTTGQGTDYEYLATLSADSLSYDEQYKHLIEKVVQEPDNVSSIEKNISWRLLAKIGSLQKKYNNPDLRTFNLLDFLQYRRIKHINLQEYYIYSTHTSPQLR